MKFVHSPMQTRLFKPSSHYQSLWSRGEQNPDFWKEVVVAFVDEKYNTEISRNRYLISICQEDPLHELYFITINN